MKTTNIQWQRMVVGISICALMVLLGAQMSVAQERGIGFSQGVNLGVAKCSGDDFDFGFGGRVFLEYAPYIHEIGIRLSGGYLRFKDTVTIGTAPFQTDQNLLFENYYATIGGVYRFTRGMLVPYLTGNIGVYHYQKEGVRPAPGPIIDGVQMSPFDVSMTSEGNAFGFNLGGGVEYFIGKKTSLSLDAVFHSIYGDADSQVMDVTVMFRFFPTK